MNVHFDPPFQPLQCIAIAVLVIAAVVFMAIRWERRSTSHRTALLLLRTAIMLLFALIVFNPVLDSRSGAKAVKPRLLVLLDASRSMKTQDVVDSSAVDPTKGNARLSRWDAARQTVLEDPALSQALERNYDVRFYSFDAHTVMRQKDELRRQTEPLGERTDLGEALLQPVLANAPRGKGSSNALQGGVLLVSDGRDNSSGYPLDAARQAKTMGFPVYTLCLGTEQKGLDIEVVAKRSQVFGTPGQKIEIGVAVRDTGILSGTAHIDLLREGHKIASQSLALSPGAHDVAFPVVEPKKGTYRYTVACAPVPGELNLVNNRANVILNILDNRTRVLVLEGRPSWDSKFLAKTLRADPTVTCDCIYQLTGSQPFALSGDASGATLHIPHRMEDFAHYDVIILGKGYEDFFDAASTEALKKWVGDRGGNLVFLRGRADERTVALRDLEPVNFGDQEIASARISLTEAGRVHPGFVFNTREDAQTVVQRLPSLISATRVQGEKALTVVLARAQAQEGGSDATQEMAMLAYQRYGQGKTLAVVGQGLWRWAFLPPDMAQYAHVYDEFWTQTVRWLVSESDFLPGQEIALHSDHTAYSLRDTVNLLGFMRGTKPTSGPAIQVSGPSGKTEKISSALADGKTADFTANYHPMDAGEYVATVMASARNERSIPASATFTVYPGQEEDTNTSADPVLMKQIAEQSGGEALRASELSELPEKLHARALALSGPDEEHTLWDRNWMLALLFALLTTEWLLRRRTTAGA